MEKFRNKSKLKKINPFERVIFGRPMRRQEHNIKIHVQGQGTEIL
jgi:hypothetical protein